MPSLLLLRHAQAEPSGPRLSDHQRALSRHGRAEAMSMGAAMREAGLGADAVLVSSARRTLETLHHVLPDARAAQVLDTLYLAGCETLLDILRGQEAARSVLLIGHNPGLHDLALHLSAGGAGMPGLRYGLPTAGLATFTLRGRWAELGPATAAPDRLLHPDPA